MVNILQELNALFYLQKYKIAQILIYNYFIKNLLNKFLIEYITNPNIYLTSYKLEKETKI